MRADEAIQDGIHAALLVADALKVLKPLIDDFRAGGVDVQYPELRFKCAEQTMEYTAGLRVKNRFWQGNYAKLKMHPPAKFRLFSLDPYSPLDEATTITNEGIVIDRRLIRPNVENFKVELEWSLESRKALSGIVYTSSPTETLADEESEIQRYWLHAELKTVDFLKEVYRNVRVEDIDVQVEVTLRDDIKSVMTPELRFEIMMMAKLGSSDRNVQRRALEYRRAHPLPRFKGDLLQVMQDTQELFQPSKFQRFLSMDGPYRLSRCSKGASLPDLFLPLYLPQSMQVYSATDLTLEQPAKDGKLVYRKSDFLRRLSRVLEGG